MNELIPGYLHHASEALDDANYLHQDGRSLALANRAYYSIFYCICALLASKETYAKTHQGADVKFHELFIKTNLFPKEAGQLARNSFEARQAADYDIEANISEEQARQLLDDARQFFEWTIDYFKEEQLRIAESD